MQPQGQMQILRHVLDHRLGIGEALAAPRVRFLDGRAIGVERGFDPGVLDGLRTRGHDVRPLSNFGAGGAQAILRDADELHGASDPRKDGRVVTT
jgi:gamma-glutamyltranspeptidase/glutathione hydrolase